MGAFGEIVLLEIADRLPFLATRTFQRVNSEGGKVMNKPTIAMTASTDICIATANKLSSGLAVGAIFRRTTLITPVVNKVRMGRLYQVNCRVKGIFMSLDCNGAMREFYLTWVRQTKTRDLGR